MKNINLHIIQILILSVFAITSYGQINNEYILELKDSSTFNVTCGNIVPAQWTVKNDSCILSTPTLFSAVSNKYVPYIVRINQSGNLTSNDHAYVQHQINGGAWITDTMIFGIGLTNVFFYSDSILLGSSNTFKIRIAMENNKTSEFWAIKNGDITIKNVSYNNPLPVTLINFNVRLGHTSVIINWTTASEINNDYFIVEKSSNASNFSKIEQVRGAGNSNMEINYKITDNSPHKGTSFYRLKQVDFDGKVTMSKIISINYKKNNTFNVYPIPVMSGSDLNIQLDEIINEECIVVIYNNNGEQIFKILSNIKKGHLNLLVPLERGIYPIHIITNSNIYINSLLVL